MVKRRKQGFWFAYDDGRRPNWIINVIEEKVFIEQYQDGGVQRMMLSRRDARMLAKRINQALDATRL
jgi:hypothetical protein